MDELNKSQLILLAILVSFVTSIATGIMTVSLLNQAPLNITQTINRVVERTVEKVAPGSSGVKEVPVVVTEEELIIKVINNASPAVGKITLPNATDKSIGLAYFVGDGSLAVTAYNNLPDPGNKVGSQYVVTLESGVKATVNLVAFDADNKLAILKVVKTETPATDKSPIIPTLKLAKSNVAVGQTVIAIGSIVSDASPVSVGIVSALSNGAGATTTMIKANAATADNLGGPLLSIQGEALGVNVGVGQAATAPVIQSLIDSVK